MFKKFIIAIIVFSLIIAGLQLFGGRDFTQVSIAWDKYQHGGDISSFSKDLGIIFSGKKISQGGLATAKLAERLIYKWTDENGIVQHSERKPNVDDYEVIKMGDVTVETQKSLDKEEIEKALNN
jgi:hypothetical protein